MSEATMTEERQAYTLLQEPEGFMDADTGLIHETYVFDGSNIGFGGIGEAAVFFDDFTLHLFKTDEDTLQNICIDVANLPLTDLKRIGAVTGLPEGGLGDDGTAMVRFEMLQPPLDQLQASLLKARSFGEWLDSADDKGPLFWNLANYYTQSFVEA
jgi:hypothetical protein